MPEDYSILGKGADVCRPRRRGSIQLSGYRATSDRPGGRFGTCARDLRTLSDLLDDRFRPCERGSGKLLRLPFGPPTGDLQSHRANRDLYRSPQQPSLSPQALITS